MNTLNDARNNMLNLFNALEATEARLSNAHKEDLLDRVLIERIKEEQKTLKEEFDEAWDLWQEAMTTERLKKMNGIYN